LPITTIEQDRSLSAIVRQHQYRWNYGATGIVTTEEFSTEPRRLNVNDGAEEAMLDDQ
jgi:hypothetical protein